MKNIEDFKDYWITRDGHVFSDKSNSYKSRKPFHEIKGFVNRNGYRYVDLVQGKKRKRYGVHQLVAKYYIPGFFDGAVVDHINCNKLDNRACNLKWVSQKENVHKTYITSGLNQVRNYNYYILISPNGERFGAFKGYDSLIKYVENNHINISTKSLRNYKHSKGWRLEIYNKRSYYGE